MRSFPVSLETWKGVESRVGRVGGGGPLQAVASRFEETFSKLLRRFSPKIAKLPQTIASLTFKVRS